MSENSPNRRRDQNISNRLQQKHSADDETGEARRPEERAPLSLQSIALRLSKQFAFRGAVDARRSILQLLTTIIPFLALLGAMAAALESAYWVSLLLAVPAAGLLVRLFIFQHDCGHGSFFKSRAANNGLGRLLSILTLTPYDYWKRSHAVHHATSGNLDKRGAGDVPTITVAEYRALSPLNKLGYRLFRNPIIMILLGAPVNFILLQRAPLGQAFRDRNARRSIMGLNLMLLAAFGLPMALAGVAPVLAIYLPVMIIAAWIGGWLFYIQHQFEETYWRRDGDWDFHVSAIAGSSYFELPRILQWFTGNIGLHHIHHLCSRIPNHRLQESFDAFPELRDITKRITLRDSLKCWRLALWDEEKRILVGFRDVAERRQ